AIIEINSIAKKDDFPIGTKKLDMNLWKGGIGAISKAKACFLHPSKAIQTKCNEACLTYKAHIFSDALITGNKLHRINGQEQLCYIVRLPIWMTSVSILTAAETPFPNKLIPAAPPTLPTDFTTEL
ncbi:hypothetical protein ACHAW6_004173, partial [Cyclotella cf. meneghiniana]